MTGSAAALLSALTSALVCAALFTFYLDPAPALETPYDADLLIMPSLAGDIVSGKASFEDWIATPAPSYFPDLLLGLAWAALFDDFRVQLAVYAVSMYLLLAASTWVLLRQITALRGGLLLLASSAPAAALFAAVVARGDSMLKFAVAPVHHSSIVPAALLSLAMVLAAAKNGPRPLHWLGLGALALLMGASDALFIPQVAVPLAVAGALASRHGLQGGSRLFAMNLSACGLSFAGLALGEILNPMQEHKRFKETWFHELHVYFTHPEWRSFVSPLDNLGERFSEFGYSLVVLADRVPMLSLAALVLLLGLAAAWRRRTDRATSFLLTALALMIASNFAACILAWPSSRYLIGMLQIVSVSCLAALLARALTSKGKGLALLAGAPAAAVCLLAAVELAFWRPGPATPWDAHCADSVLASEAARHGMGQYWFLRTLPLFSDEVDTVVPHLGEEFYWIVQNLKDGGPARDFAVVKDEYNKSASYVLKERNLVKDFGLPSKMVACNRGSYLIYTHPSE